MAPNAQAYYGFEEKILLIPDDEGTSKRQLQGRDVVSLQTAGRLCCVL